MKFTEEKLEQAFAKLLEQDGYSHHLADCRKKKISGIYPLQHILTFRN
jgi:hypothetical protein